ncbi:MAG TPA: hypothetical protein VFX18_01910 [Candidatus Nitrosocosmicus sp.]|nr:hypothetical protein [Candidatus Nitrosocosmicus sp.]
MTKIIDYECNCLHLRKDHSLFSRVCKKCSCHFFKGDGWVLIDDGTLRDSYELEKEND